MKDLLGMGSKSSTSAPTSPTSAAVPPSPISRATSSISAATPQSPISAAVVSPASRGAISSPAQLEQTARLLQSDADKAHREANKAHREVNTAQNNLNMATKKNKAQLEQALQAAKNNFTIAQTEANKAQTEANKARTKVNKEKAEVKGQVPPSLSSPVQLSGRGTSPEGSSTQPTKTRAQMMAQQFEEEHGKPLTREAISAVPGTANDSSAIKKSVELFTELAKQASAVGSGRNSLQQDSASSTSTTVVGAGNLATGTTSGQSTQSASASSSVAASSSQLQPSGGVEDKIKQFTALTASTSSDQSTASAGSDDENPKAAVTRRRPRVGTRRKRQSHPKPNTNVGAGSSAALSTGTTSEQTTHLASVSSSDTAGSSQTQSILVSDVVGSTVSSSPAPAVSARRVAPRVGRLKQEAQSHLESNISVGAGSPASPAAGRDKSSVKSHISRAASPTRVSIEKLEQNAVKAESEAERLRNEADKATGNQKQAAQEAEETAKTLRREVTLLKTRIAIAETSKRAQSPRPGDTKSDATASAAAKPLLQPGAGGRRMSAPTIPTGSSPQKPRSLTPTPGSRQSNAPIPARTGAVIGGEGAGSASAEVPKVPSNDRSGVAAGPATSSGSTDSPLPARTGAVIGEGGAPDLLNTEKQKQSEKKIASVEQPTSQSDQTAPQSKQPQPSSYNLTRLLNSCICCRRNTNTGRTTTALQHSRCSTFIIATCTILASIILQVAEIYINRKNTLGGFGR